MLIRLDTAYTDTTAADLRFALGLPPQPALRELVVPLPGAGSVTLRLLGASHQIALVTAAGELTETVACLPRALDTAALPESFSGPSYVFDSEVRTLTARRFAAEVAALRDRSASAGAAGEHILAGEFPGARDALTVLAARVTPAGASWWTAHAYPQTGELVLTKTVVTS